MRIGLLTSGGDAPGMNAALRSAAISALGAGHQVVGIRRGYEGLLAADVTSLLARDVYGITRQGGTILGSARSKRFPTPEGQIEAHKQLAALGLGALIVIGGNGSLTGAHVLAQGARSCLIVGIPASIDNDIGCTGLSIGVDTAVNTIVEACDRISDTALAHRRAFIVEVMGRRCGYLAMRAGVAAEADAILYAEKSASHEEIVARLRKVLCRALDPGRGQTRALIVKAEGVAVDTNWLTAELQKAMDKDLPGVEVRATILGHVVRGGRPSAQDRTMAQRLGYGAIQAVLDGQTDVMVAWDAPSGMGVRTEDNQVSRVGLADVLEETERLLDGTSVVTRKRIALLERAQDLFTV